jgi:hypothetical protein
MRSEVEKRYNLQNFGKMGRKINIQFSRDVYDTRNLLDLFIEVRDKAEDEIEFLEGELGQKH